MEATKRYSSFISSAFVRRRTNLFLARVIQSFLFRRIDFDEESLALLREYSSKGTLVFASFQSSTTSLLILMNLLRKHDLPLPEVALGYRPYPFQILGDWLRIAFVFIRRVFNKGRYRDVDDEEYLAELVRDRKIIVTSLFSRSLFRRRYVDIKADAIQELIEIQRQTETPIFLVPQIIFWNRNPERTRSFDMTWALMTLRATGDRGLFSGWLTIFKSATPPFMRLSAPYDLRREIKNARMEDSREIERFVRSRLLESYNHEKRTILGPVIKSQPELMERVLEHPNVIDTINRLVRDENKTQRKLRKQAISYYREIAADFSIIYIKYFEKTLDFVFSRIFDGIQYDIEDFRRIREANQKGPLIIMPAHKSHMDYLIISSLFYRNKLIPPHIWSGSNLIFFPMGKIFRRSGAFFVRRSFRGLPLYSVIIKQYIKTLVNEGYPIEFFFEGGRSRTGKIMKPQVGAMSYMIDAIDEGYNKDLVFVPMSISYDRILEENSYSKELKGKEKTAETTGAFLQSRKLLKRKYGKVYVSFSDPVTLSELRRKVGGGEGVDLSVKIADQISKRISDVIIATPFSIVTSAMLTATARGFSREILKRNTLVLYRYLKAVKAPMSDNLETEAMLDDAIDYVIDSYKGDNIVREIEFEYAEGTESHLSGLYTLTEGERGRINFYKNMVIHHLLPVSFISLGVLSHESPKGISEKKLFETYLDIQDLLSKEFVYPAFMNDASRCFKKSLDHLKRIGILSVTKGTVKIRPDAHETLRLFARLLHDYYESYFVAVSTVIQAGKKKKTRKDLVTEIRGNGVRMYHLGTVRLMESLSLSSYNSALNYLIGKGFLDEKTVDRKVKEVRVRDMKSVEAVRERLSIYLSELQKRPEPKAEAIEGETAGA